MAALTLYGSSVADSILTTACLMAPTSGGGETSKQTTITGTGATYAEITSQGSSVADVTAIPGTPTGKGWIYYPGAGTFAAGNWSASVTLQFVLHGSPNQTTLRFFRRSGGVYTLIGSVVATTATLAKTTYTFAATSMAAITFGASDGLYVDLWWHDASVDPSGDNPTIYLSTSATAGVTDDLQVTTSAFSSAVGALGGTMAGHGTLTGTLAVTGVGKIAGQTFTNGISNFIFGAHDHGEPGMSVPYPSSAQITLAKQLGGPPMLLRTFFNSTATDAQITARLNAISDCGGIPLICLQTPTNASFNTHVVTFVGSGCNLYEFGNEPDGPNTPLSVAAYSAAWNAQIPNLRSINTNASFLGCSASLGYTTTWLNNCHASGVKPDGVTIHNYPCHLDTTAAACLADANLGAQVSSYRHTVESIFPGQNIAVGFTEWNVDWANPMVGYSQTEPFVSQFYHDVLQSFINANADYACVFSLFSGGNNFPMINTSTGAKTGFYTAFQHAVSALMNFSTFALVQSATGSVGAANAASVTVPTKATGSGHLLVAFVTVQGASVTITPPGGWAQIDTTQGISGSTSSVAMFYRQNSASGVTSHVFSFSASCNASVAFEEWSGVATSNALDQEVAKQNANSTTALTGTTGTLAGSGELAIWGLAVPATNVLTYSGITNGYREDTSANATSSQATRAEATLFYKTGTSSAATSSGATMSGAGAAGNTTILAVFRAAGAAVALSGTMAGHGTLTGTLSGGLTAEFFPANNIWNVDISAAPVHSNSATFITNMGGASTPLTVSLQLPWCTVDASQSNVTIHLGLYASESDVGPSPVPASAPVESNSDKHVLVWSTTNQKIYELYHGALQGDNSWNADQQSIFDVTSNALRTSGWSSTDAAGLPVLPGVLRYTEIAQGAIRHALRVVVSNTHSPSGHVWPARHDDGIINSAYIPYGSRMRLKASVNISSYSATNQIILQCLKTYGVMIADRTGDLLDFNLTADTNASWSTSDLANLAALKTTDFEVVDVSGLMIDPNSAATVSVAHLSGAMAGVGSLTGTMQGSSAALSGECDGIGTLSGTLTVPPTIRGTYTVVIGGVLI